MRACTAPAAASGARARARLRRFAPVAVIVLAMLAVFASGAHRHLSLETLVRHRMAIDAFMAHHMIAALGVFIAVYIVVVALSIPGALFLTITGGIDHGDPTTVEQVAEALAACGAAHELLSPDAAAERWPGMRFDGPVLFQPDAGRAHADATVRALQDSATRHGADLRYAR